ncbi:MAG: site-specific integrase [Ilumatobacteraceae bacterium]
MKGERALYKVADEWLASQVSTNTRAAYRADFEAFAQWCRGIGATPLNADTVTVGAFQAARRAAGDSATTIRRRWYALSSFYQFAMNARSTDSNPLDAASRPSTESSDTSPTPLLSSQSVKNYLAKAAALDTRLEALVSLLVFDGLKLGEALALDVDDLSGRPPNVILSIRRHDSIEQVALHDITSRAVRRCAGDREGEPLFTNARRSLPEGTRRRLTRFGADHLIKQLRTDEDGPLTTNALRRFHVTASQAAGTALDRVRERAGLTDVRSLRRYLGPQRTKAAPDRASAEHKSR